MVHQYTNYIVNYTSKLKLSLQNVCEDKNIFCQFVRRVLGTRLFTFEWIGTSAHAPLAARRSSVN